MMLSNVKQKMLTAKCSHKELRFKTKVRVLLTLRRNTQCNLSQIRTNLSSHYHSNKLSWHMVLIRQLQRSATWMCLPCGIFSQWKSSNNTDHVSSVLKTSVAESHLEQEAKTQQHFLMPIQSWHIHVKVPRVGLKSIETDTLTNLM